MVGFRFFQPIHSSFVQNTANLYIASLQIHSVGIICVIMKKLAPQAKRKWQKLSKRRFFRQTRSMMKISIERHGARYSEVKLVRYHLVQFAATRGKRLRQHEIAKYVIEVPVILDFITNPDETSNFFLIVDEVLNDSRPYHLHISHKQTEYLDIGASFLFDKRMKDYRQRWRRRGYKLLLEGTISDSRPVNNFLLSFGLLKNLGINTKNLSISKIDTDYPLKFKTFERSGSISNELANGKASEGLARYFDGCLNVHHHQFTPEALGDLISAVSEIICNAEQHSGEEQWYVRGCYDKDSKICSFAILSFGTSIYETLQVSEKHQVFEKVRILYQENKPMQTKFLEFIYETDTTEALYNVIALQDGISSKRTDIGENSRRGFGLMDVLEYMNALTPSNEKAQIAVISGKSLVVIDFTYPIQRIPIANGAVMRRICFNDSADLFQTQDPRKVMQLQYKFPGTMITGRFKIDEAHLQTLVKP